MPYAMVPPGYRAVFLGQSNNIEGLGTFTPLEESTAEGALILMRLDFAEYPSEEALGELNQACLDAGIPPWLGESFVVYADTAGPSIYLAWQKGIAWMPVIIGMLALTVLPPLLTAVVWWILPEEIKSLISGLISLGMMMLVMWLMMSVMKPLTAPEKPKRLEEAKT
jgi:hypothetical protein